MAFDPPTWYPGMKSDLAGAIPIDQKTRCAILRAFINKERPPFAYIKQDDATAEVIVAVSGMRVVPLAHRKPGALLWDLGDIPVSLDGYSWERPSGRMLADRANVPELILAMRTEELTEFATLLGVDEETPKNKKINTILTKHGEINSCKVELYTKEDLFAFLDLEADDASDETTDSSD